MDKLIRNAYAKINLGLDVTGRRPNGYHDLRMIMQTVDLKDVLEFEKTDIPGEIVLTCNRPDLACDESNLIVKAARLMFQVFRLPGGLRIRLTKNIPMAAGLAGGSTDAAAVFNGLNTLYGLNQSKKELCELGVNIGADVPYCIVGGTCLAEGIGEVLTPLPALPEIPVVIMKPDFDVSTKYVYESLHAAKDVAHPDIDTQMKGIEAGDLQLVAATMDNMLQSVTIEKYPEIRRLKEELIKLGSFGSMMSGSGPSVFGLFETKEQAEAAAGALKERYSGIFVKPSKFVPDIESGSQDE